jgi:predicted phage-related endonuclease
MEPGTPAASDTAVEAPTVEQREGYIGGSDLAAILGFSPYATPFSVFLQKKGLAAPKVIGPELQEKFDFGHAMEPVIAQMFERRTRLVVTRPNKATDFMRSAERPFLAGHIDFWVTTPYAEFPSAILECKNIEYRGDEWGDPEPLGKCSAHLVALYYLTQCDHYMALTKVDVCYLAALFGGCRLVVYEIHRSPEREAILIEAETRFWVRVLNDDPPDFSGNIDDLTLALQTKYRAGLTAAEAKKAKANLQLAPETSTLLQEIKQERRKQAKAKKEADAKSAAFVLLMNGETGYLHIGDEPWGSLLMQDRKTFDDFAFQMQHPDLAEKFTVTKRIGPILRLRKDPDEDTNEE